MRVSERQERVSRAAADLSGETLTGFVLGAATERAEEVLDRAQRIELGRETFRRFVEAVDRPTEEMPTLARYAREQSPIPARCPASRCGRSRRSVIIRAWSSSILGLRCLTGGCASRLGLLLRPSSVSREGAPSRDA
jgi:uncharacterized protein (DUF1778 family)